MKQATITMLLASALALSLAFAPPLEADIVGSWSAEVREDGRIHLNMRRAKESWGSTSSYDAPRFQGLTLAMLQSQTPATADFRIASEAGDIEFSGFFAKGKGTGDFRFVANPGFESRLRSAGVRMERKSGKALTEQDLFSMAMFDVSTSRVRELNALGFRDLSLDDLFSAAIHGVNTAFVNGLRAAGATETSLDEYVSYRIHGLTPDYIREMRSLFGDLSLKKLKSMRIHGVTKKYIEELRELGYTNIPVDDLVSMRIHGVTARYIRELRVAGYENIPVRKLVSMRIHGIDPKQLK